MLIRDILIDLPIGSGGSTKPLVSGWQDFVYQKPNIGDIVAIWHKDHAEPLPDLKKWDEYHASVDWDNYRWFLLPAIR